MDDDCRSRYNDLIDSLKGYPAIAVAYSGGVDSTLLAYAACEAVGGGNVYIYHVVSCLMSTQSSSEASRLIYEQFSEDVTFRKIEMDLLDDRHINQNTPQRCYFCKKKIYLRLLEENLKDKIDVLLDGTNIDDLKDDRPGFRAICELRIKTPFIEFNINKTEIRQMAAEVGLPNAFLSSDSCLATRLPVDTIVDRGKLRRIEEMETFVKELGFSGCRVTPHDTFVIIQLIENEFVRIINKDIRKEIITYFQDYGFEKILLNLSGR